MSEKSGNGKEKRKILIALPCYRTMEAEAVDSLCQVITWSNRHLEGYSVEMKMAARQQVVVARSGLAQHALDHDFEYILFIDDDHVWPVDVIARLLAHRKEAVSAVYFRRTPPYGPVAFRGVKLDNGEVVYERLRGDEKGLQPVDAVGMGCFLLEVDILKKMEQPFFVMEGRQGSDMHFSWRIRELGIPIYLDCDLVVGHLGDRPIVGRELRDLYNENNAIGVAFMSNVTVSPSALLIGLEERLTPRDKIKRLELRVSIYHDDYAALRQLGILYIDAQRFEEAEVVLKKCIELTKTNGERQHLLSALYYLGNVYWEQKKIKEAEQAYKECLQIERHHIKAAERLVVIKKLYNGSAG